MYAYRFISVCVCGVCVCVCVCVRLSPSQHPEHYPMAEGKLRPRPRAHGVTPSALRRASTANQC